MLRLEKGWRVALAAVILAALAAYPAASAACDDGPPKVSPRQPKPWRFGVISDTQWTVKDDGRNPGTSAVDITTQVNAQFIEQGVDLVVAVGD